jgi:hypothetical protein
MTFLAAMQPDGLLSSDSVRSLGSELQAGYAAADPFPHIMIDDFLPAEVAEMCLREFPSAGSAETAAYDRAQERLKTQYNPDALSANVRNLFYTFNSRPFLKVIENITGIKGLIPDPYFLGAGFHEIGQGGYLSMHADFNHHKPMNLERRINILVYLNKDWKEGYGGQLELWTDDMKTCVQSIVPVFNRCVIFNTTSRSWHGNPKPVSHPHGVTRKSLALYYYTATWSEVNREHTTQFRTRQGTQDKVDWQVRGAELIADLTPPLLKRNLQKLRQGAKLKTADAENG